MHHPPSKLCQRANVPHIQPVVNRRQMLSQAGAGFGALALNGMLMSKASSSAKIVSTSARLSIPRSASGCAGSISPGSSIACSASTAITCSFKSIGFPPSDIRANYSVLRNRDMAFSISVTRDAIRGNLRKAFCISIWFSILTAG